MLEDAGFCPVRRIRSVHHKAGIVGFGVDAVLGLQFTLDEERRDFVRPTAASFVSVAITFFPWMNIRSRSTSISPECLQSPD